MTARAAACDGEHGQPIPDSAACHLYQQDWGIPVTIHADTSDGTTNWIWTCAVSTKTQTQHNHPFG